MTIELRSGAQSEFARRVRTLDRIGDGLRKRDRIGRYETAGLRIAHHCRNITRWRRYDRRACGKRLEDRNRLVVEHRRVDEDVGLVKQARHLLRLDAADESHVPEGQPGGELLQGTVQS